MPFNQDWRGRFSRQVDNWQDRVIGGPSGVRSRRWYNGDDYDVPYMSGGLHASHGMSDSHRRHGGLRWNRDNGGWDMRSSWTDNLFGGAGSGRGPRNSGPVYYPQRDPSWRSDGEMYALRNEYRQAAHGLSDLPIATGFSGYYPGRWGDCRHVPHG